MFIILLITYFLAVNFQFQVLSTSKPVWVQQSPVPLQFPLPDVVIAMDATDTHWAFYYQVSGLPLSLSGPGQAVCAWFILPYRILKPLP